MAWLGPQWQAASDGEEAAIAFANADFTAAAFVAARAAAATAAATTGFVQVPLSAPPQVVVAPPPPMKPLSDPGDDEGIPPDDDVMMMGDDVMMTGDDVNGATGSVGVHATAFGGGACGSFEAT